MAVQIGVPGLAIRGGKLGKPVREILQREFVTVATPYGSIRIKLAKAPDGRVLNVAPEYEDCRAAAEAQLVALRDVQTAALRAYAETA